MSHELFVIDRKPQLDEQEAGRVAYLRDKLSAAEGLGLEAQADSIKADIATVERGRLITTPPMTDTEMTIWRAWLPTAYTDNGKDEGRQLAKYNFDRIPSPVLNLWQKHKESGAFERFEIWTPENPRPDPILVGVNGNARHLLARWGESDGNLVSFDDIKRELVRRWHANEEIGGEPYWEEVLRNNLTEKAFLTAMMTTYVSVFIVMGVTVLLGLKDGGAGSVIALFGITVAVSVSTFIYIRRRMIKKLWESSALMQAITKDTTQTREMLPTSA